MFSILILPALLILQGFLISFAFEDLAKRNKNMKKVISEIIPNKGNLFLKSIPENNRVNPLNFFKEKYIKAFSQIKSKLKYNGLQALELFEFPLIKLIYSLSSIFLFEGLNIVLLKNYSLELNDFISIEFT